MTVRDLCNLFGGQRATARIIGIGDRHMRRLVSDNEIPEKYISDLIDYANSVKLDLCNNKNFEFKIK